MSKPPRGTTNWVCPFWVYGGGLNGPGIRPDNADERAFVCHSPAFCHSRRMLRLRRALRELPVPLRHAVIGAVVLGVTGGIVGLAIGLRAYVPTAWFAILEVGVPAALLGAVLGLVVGSLAYVYHYVHDN